MTTCDFLDALKARYKLPSDYALAHFMGIARSGISSYRSGKTRLDDSIAMKVAKLLDLDAGYVVACAHAERANRDDVRDMWQKTANALKRSAGALLVCLLFYSAGGQNALASTAYAGKLPTFIIMLNWLGWLRRRLRAILIGMRFNVLNPALLLAACLLLSSMPANAAGLFASKDWTQADTTRQVALTALQVIDWGQTLDIAAKPDDFHERNPILGNHPSRGQVNTMVALSIAGAWLIARKLPPKKRRIFQILVIGVESANVAQNHRIGLRIDF